MANYSNVRTGVKGVDVSAFQGNINWATVKAQGVSFAIIRTVMHWQTDLDNDVTYQHIAVDPYAYQNAHNARANGIEVAGYHLVTPQVFPGLDNARKEAERFADGLMRVFGDLDPGYPYGRNIPTLDIEQPYTEIPVGSHNYFNDYALGFDAYINWVEECARHLIEITGFNTVMIYTANYYSAVTQGFAHTIKGTVLQKYPLWLAAKDPTLYTGVNTAPEIAYPNASFGTFGNWGSWVGWQYSLDTPDVRMGATYGASSPDIDLDVLAPGLGIEVLSDAYWKPRNTTIGGSVMATGGTNLTNISQSGDLYIKSPTSTKETKVNQMLMAFKDFSYTDLTNTASNVNGIANTLRIIDGIPGKKVNIIKIQLYCPTSTWAGGTQGFSWESDEVTPKVWMTSPASNLTSGNKTNTDGFVGFTNGANFMIPFPDGAGVIVRDIATPTAGRCIAQVFYEYI